MVASRNAARILDTRAPWTLRVLFTTLLVLAALWGWSCTPDGGDGAPAADTTPGSGKSAGKARTYNLDIPQVTYRWNPDAGDASVPAELGGPGFTGEGWETNMEFPALGVPGVPQGGSMARYIPDWPATLRLAGKDYNTSFNYMVRDLCYESLIGIHPNTLDYIPGLATHWQISTDKMTYRFRINPEARWSDGKEVTADDVVATYDLLMDPTLLDPSGIMTFGKLERPVALSKYVVEVRVKDENWRNFLYFGGARVFPAHEVSIPGSEYLDKYQFSYTANSGPYIVNQQDINSGKSISIRRRANWWDQDNPAWVGMWNIAQLKFVVVKDPNLAFEKVKKGELDYYVVPKAQWWAEELPKVDSVKRGLLLMRKFYTNAPTSWGGIAINMKKPPLDDLSVRKALCHLCDRKTMIEKLFFNEYSPLNSYYQNSPYQNPKNEMVEYDELGAVELLEEAGWKEFNSEGYRVKDGKELGFTLNYRTPLSERSLTVFQESCKKAGIRIELQLLTPAASWKNLQQKEYELMSTAWGALIFPNPETSYHGKLADDKNNNNVTGFKNARVDELCAAYDREYDVARRLELIREIDGLVFNEHPYVLHWYNPSQRILAWNKFGMPEWGGWRTSDYDGLFFCWWVDPEKERLLEEAKKDSSRILPAGDIENRFWEAWNAAREAKKAPSRS